MRAGVIAVLIILALSGAALFGVGQYLSHRQEVELAGEALTAARGYAETGEWEQVLASLERLEEEAPTPEVRDRGWHLIATAHEELGQMEEAASMWGRIGEEAEDNGLRSEAFFRQAMASLESGGEEEEALALAERIAELGAPEYRAHPAMIEGRVMLERGDRDEARAVLGQARRQFATSGVVGEIEQMLTDLNFEALYDQDIFEGDDFEYRVASGDTLDGIRRRHNTTANLIARVNGINVNSIININQRLKIPVRDFRVEVYLDDFTLALFDGDEFFGAYPCRTGLEDNPTPTGDFTIDLRLVDPPWTSTTGPRRNYEGGAEGNELGARWMGFAERESVGIHGTIHPETIGTRSSQGCVGLLNEDVIELYDLVTRGTEVAIYESREEAQRAQREAPAETESADDTQDGDADV